jgi:hypothetical protein
VDTPELVRACAWRFYAGRYLNAARFGVTGTPFSSALTIKGFFLCDPGGARGSENDVRELLRSTIVDAYPAFAWRFGRTLYEPHRFAYDAEAQLHPFDYASQASVEAVPPDCGTFWDFVEQQCREDEIRPQIFGEALRARFMMAPDGTVFLRFTFNHALVDGIMIFKFMTAWEPVLNARGARLLDLDTFDYAPLRRWRTARIEYTVEDIGVNTHPGLAERGFDYMAILYELAKRRWFTGIRQAIALPRDPTIQLTIAPVRKAFGYNRFRRLNETEIKEARNGTRLSNLLEDYKNDPAGGDEYIQRLISLPILGRILAAMATGEMLISSYMFRHPRYLAFPVVHPLQREGAAICCVWDHENETTVRVTRARNLRGPRSGRSPDSDSHDSG